MRIIAAAVFAFGWSAADLASAQTDVALKRLPDAAYEVDGEFTVDASSAAVWGVLTDYEGIPSFVASMRSSRVRETREDGSLLVEQKAVGGMFFLTRTVTILLEVRQEPELLRFEDIGRESFWRYEGSWSTERAPEGVRVSYHLIAQPDFVAPAVLMSRAMRRGARDLLEQVRVEIVRRSNAGGRKI
ncbi:MAG: SRPBCC family protein [Elusimicrobia bacterium]|nr:SRPBCC family protein [Elusimicrobiota bacterium]